MDDFKPVPSLLGLYEINSAGVIRRTKTKRVLKQFNGTVPTSVNGKGNHSCVAKLLNEVHGLPLPPPSPYWKKKPVTIIRGNEVRHFDSVDACLEYLSATFFYSKNTIKGYLSQHKDFCGWKIIYRKPEQNFGATTETKN